MKSILVLNAGSSSLKFAIFSLEPVLAQKPSLTGQIEGIGASPCMTVKKEDGEKISCSVPAKGDLDSQHRDALTFLFSWLHEHASYIEVAAAGHRILHGGEEFSAPVVLTPDVMTILAKFIPLGRLHQPHNLRAINVLSELMPSVPQVGCFDTAFHRTQPAVAQTFAVPRAITAEGVRRYGFHGLSYDYISRQLPEVLGDRAKGRVIVAHLGNGASMSALVNCRCVATTMGFTALDGIMMGTRTGSIDPGVLLYLMEQKGMDAKAIMNLLYKESGLLGVSGISQDMRVLLDSPQPEAAQAVELFCYRISRELGSLAAAAQGIDALVFTGGIGENAAPIRQAICEQAKWLGISLDASANQVRGQLATISTPDSAVPVVVIPTNEELMIARYTTKILNLN